MTCDDGNRYGAESFPGITQALQDGNEQLAQEQVLVAAGCVENAAAFLSGEAAENARKWTGFGDVEAGAVIPAVGASATSIAAVDP